MTQRLSREQGDTVPFWRRKTLAELDSAEWESLCDGCGRCCLLKLEDEDTGEIHLTRLSCRLLDLEACRCSNYAERQQEVHDCIVLDPDKAASISWLPPTCAYRLVGEGRDLPWWHPLVSGDPSTVAEAGIAVHDWAVPETPKRLERLYRYIIADWAEDEGGDRA